MTRHPIDLRQFGHELRTPLNAILGNVELLLDGTAGPLSSEARKCLDEVQTASRQLSRQVKRLLLWSELRAGAARRDDAALDLIALLREVRATTRAAALTIAPSDARLVVRGDPFWLHTLLLEVLALCGAGENASEPTIRLQNRADGGSLAFSWRSFCAADAGPLQVALIEAVAQLQGAAAALTSDGLTLYWPSTRLAAAAPAEIERAKGRADEPSRRRP
jgi:His Kinase A (phospho-acceptor) domain